MCKNKIIEGLQAPLKEEKLSESLKRSIINVNHNHTYDGTNGVRKPYKMSVVFSFIFNIKVIKIVNIHNV